MTFATCRGYDRAFTVKGWGTQSAGAPCLCRDCALREREHHGRHATGVACIAHLLEPDAAARNRRPLQIEYERETAK